MKFIKSFENQRVDTILDKISKTGMDSLSDYEKDFLNKFSKEEPTEEIQKEMDSKSYTDHIGPYEAKLVLYDIIPSSLNDSSLDDSYADFRGVEDYSRWNGKLFVNDKEYDGQILFQNEDYLSGYFGNDESDVFTDLEGLEHEVDAFLSWGFYHAIGVNESLILEGRIDDIRDKYDKKIGQENVQYFYENDPTDNLAYFDWLCDRFSKLTDEEKEKMKGDVKETITKMITKFNNIKTKLPNKHRQINRIKSVSELANVLNQDQDWENLVKFSKEMKDYADVHHNSYEWLVYSPYDEDASSEFGDKAWCTVYDPPKHFKKHFGHKGALTYFMNKLDSELNFAIEQTDYENGEPHGHVWDHKDKRPIRNGPLKTIARDLVNKFGYLPYNTELRDDELWNKIVEDLPQPEMTETMLLPTMEYLFQNRGVAWCSKQFGPYSIFETIDVSDGYKNIAKFINEKLKELILKSPRTYIEDEGVLYWTIMDNFPDIADDIMEMMPWEDREDLIPICIFEELGFSKVWSSFPNDYRREELVELYIKRNYSPGENIEQKIEDAWNIDVNDSIDNEEISKVITDNLNWKEYASTIYHELEIEDILELLEKEGVYNG